MKKLKKGFTLAEVLISLGIVGVIASLTMPALLANINENTWAQGLKVNYSVLTNGFAQMLAQEDCQNLDETELWSTIIKKEDITTEDPDVKRVFDKYFKIEKMMTGVPGNAQTYNLQKAQSSLMDDSIRFYLANSATINIVLHPASINSECYEIKENGGMFCENFADIFLDVNGDKKPNQFGKDIYKLYLSREGRLFAQGSEALYLFDNNNTQWDTSGECTGKNPKGDGLSCTARVIEEGYKINYK